MAVDPQFWNDEPVVFREPGTLFDQHEEEIIANLADPDYAKSWLKANDDMHELLFKQRLAADKKLAKIHTLAVLWTHSTSTAKQHVADELLKILTRK